MALVFDIETDGLYEQTTKIHSLVIYDTETEEVYSCANAGNFLPISKGVELLQTADEIVGHNIIKFDIPVIQKLYPSFKPEGKIFDTLLLSKLIYPDIAVMDDINIRKGRYRAAVTLKTGKKKMIRGSYALFAWGYRLEEYKGEYFAEEAISGADIVLTIDANL